MSWNSPTNLAEMAQSVRNSHAFNAGRCEIRGSWVAVLSSERVRAELATAAADGHALSDHIITGAETFENHYRTATDGTQRTPHPSTVLYYLTDARSGRAMLALQADGTVLDELETVRPDLRPATVQALREAIAEAAKRLQERS